MPINRFESVDFAEYRGYLKFLARSHLSKRYCSRLDHSDVVQQALLDAFAARDQFQGQTEAERLAWLRQILVRTILRATRGLHAKKRDVRREHFLKAAPGDSSPRLEKLLAIDQSSPSQQAMCNERLRIVADAITRLPKAQRQVILLRYWDKLTIQELAESLGKSTPAVAGLLFRATRELRNKIERKMSA